MTETKIKISGLSSKVTEHILQSNFSLVGPIVKLNMFDDLQSNKCAELTYSSEELALKAVQEFNGKQIIKNQVKVELVKVNYFYQ